VRAWQSSAELAQTSAHCSNSSSGNHGSSQISRTASKTPEGAAAINASWQTCILRFTSAGSATTATNANVHVSFASLLHACTFQMQQHENFGHARIVLDIMLKCTAVNRQATHVNLSRLLTA
jgi:hypothetical protein